MTALPSGSKARSLVKVGYPVFFVPYAGMCRVLDGFFEQEDCVYPTGWVQA